MKSIIATLALGVIVLSGGARADLTPPTVEMSHAQILRMEPPSYPAIALKAGIEGEVVVDVQVDTDGKTKNVRVVRSSSSSLEQAVIASVMEAEFVPATMPSGKVTSWVQIPFTFKKR